ncbi:hypothetical protein LB577_20875 [Mesorhizobium sp. B283B1A]|uniref:hypothetical protein n=1 Tax=Mesorhizobium TaxID=68287 RepID=UPI001CD05D2C|nr:MULTISPECIES: hypothetical protein [Mesorhizobium]MCA0049368.1 hypothetical protein [Mesorhizobium sp. B283B1A]UQS66495.1 hypothetical protein M5D98_09175 [Mesorhizobium opportunistum]
MDETADFVVNDVLDQSGQSDSGIFVELVDPERGRVRLHLTTATAELLCERIADALERRYGEGAN